MSRPRPAVLVAAAVVIVLALAGGAVLVQRRLEATGSANGSAPVRDVDELAGRWTPVNVVRSPDPFDGLELEVDGDRLLVRTGCNSGGGEVAVEDSRLVLRGDGLALTEMACVDPSRSAAEQRAVEMLTSRPRMERSGPYLFLHWGEGERYWLGLERVGG
ncbi:META domain-containing protein [Phycicoccus avicenniae]|uniref:META domain-containing protein n=1 Tax=Phycicoccus avicenniae TaxID=2828860 RepID=UPI003D279970